MGFRRKITDYSRGDNLCHFWRLYRMQIRAENRLIRDIFTFMMSRSAHRHGGYIGPGAKFKGTPSLPHGLHGVFISRYAVIGENCRIYQNVTIGEVDGKAPVIGNGCLIGAGATIIGNVRVGNNTKVGAGVVISTDVPDNSTVVSHPPRIIEHTTEGM